MPKAFASGFDDFGNKILGVIDDIVVSRGVFELSATKRTFKLGNTVKTVASFVFTNNSPEVVASDAASARVFHRFKMEQGCGGIFGAEVGGDAIMIAGFVAIKNHEILRKNFAAEFGGIHDDFIMCGKSSKLFGEEIFGESDEFLPGGVFNFKVVESFDDIDSLYFD